MRFSALSDRIAVIYEGRIMDVILRQDAAAEKIGLLMAGVRPEERRTCLEKDGTM